MELVQGAIKACDDRQSEWDTNVAQAEERWNARWKDSHVQQWRPLRDKLTKALKDGSHITVEDLPIKIPRYSGDPVEGPLWRPFNRGKYKSNYGNRRRAEDWYADHNYGPRPITEKETFEVVLVFLEMIEEEVITTGQLQQAGFRNLEKLVSAAASGGWSDKVA